MIVVSFIKFMIFSVVNIIYTKYVIKKFKCLCLAFEKNKEVKFMYQFFLQYCRKMFAKNNVI